MGHLCRLPLISLVVLGRCKCYGSCLGPQLGILIAWGRFKERNNPVISYIFISLQLGIGCESEMGRVRDEATAGMHSDLLIAS